MYRKESSERALELLKKITRSRGASTKLAQAMDVGYSTIHNWVYAQRVPKEYEEMIEVFYNMNKRETPGVCGFNPNILCTCTNARKCAKCGWNPKEAARRHDAYIERLGIE